MLNNIKQQFGGSWTEDKLKRLQKYLNAYTTIFSKNPRAQHLIPIYIDAFAGTGYRTTKKEKTAKSLFQNCSKRKQFNFWKEVRE